MEIGKYLEQERLKRNWSLRDLALKAGGAVSYMTIDNIETGRTANPGILTLLAIAKALEIHPMKLFYLAKGLDPELVDKKHQDHDLLEAMQATISEYQRKLQTPQDS